MSEKIIKEVARKHDLDLDFRVHSGGFRTVYLAAPEGLSYFDQHNLLVAAKIELKEQGVDFTRTRFDNPPIKRQGEWVEGHPRHGQPLLELDMIWKEDC